MMSRLDDATLKPVIFERDGATIAHYSLWVLEFRPTWDGGEWKPCRPYASGAATGMKAEARELMRDHRRIWRAPNWQLSSYFASQDHGLVKAMADLLNDDLAFTRFRAVRYSFEETINSGETANADADRSGLSSVSTENEKEDATAS